MHDEYTTVRTETAAEIKVAGSRFMATALPILTKQEAEQFLARIRREFWDATHHCYAYRLGADGTRFRFNDDGEPSGSAGKPILSAIDKCTLTDVLVVVTRYFGGTKLGVGGLVRAYGDATELVLGKADKVVKHITENLVATFPHAHISNVLHVGSRGGAKIVDITYDEDVHATLEIRISRGEELRAALVNHTSGNILLKQPTDNVG